MTGITTSEVFGETNAHRNKECLTYYSYKGSLYENGGIKQGGRAVSDGEVIVVQVDPIIWQIKWSVGQQYLAATIIPEWMRNKALYFIVLMFNQNDVIELF